MFKELEWKSRNDGVIYAEPYGFKYSYFIYPPNADNNYYELALIEDDGTYVEDYFIYETQQKAIGFVEQHKNNILRQHIQINSYKRNNVK